MEKNEEKKIRKIIDSLLPSVYIAKLLREKTDNDRSAPQGGETEL